MPAGRPRNDSQLDHCRDISLSCKDCVQICAMELAAVTVGLSLPQAKQMFNIMYPESNCQRMASAFAQAFQQTRLAGMRKPVSSETVFELSPAVAVA